MNALVINNLTKIYATGLKAIDDVSFEVREGDFFALLGPNGAGKSTLIGILTSLVNKTSGEISVFGKNLDSNKNLVKQMIGLVPQEFNFNQFETPLEILINQAGFYGVTRRIALERAEYYLRKLQLWEKREQVSRTLSGGMKRRLMIARALVHKPKILILDEPTAGVDIEIRRATWEFLEELNLSGTTIILTTHYLEEAEQLCNGLGIINKGKLLELTTVKKFLSKLEHETIIFDGYNTPKMLEHKALQDFAPKSISNDSFELSYPKQFNLNQVFKALDAADINVTSFRNKSNRLEELFISLLK